MNHLRCRCQNYQPGVKDDSEDMFEEVFIDGEVIFEEVFDGGDDIFEEVFDESDEIFEVFDDGEVFLY